MFRAHHLHCFLANLSWQCLFHLSFRPIHDVLYVCLCLLAHERRPLVLEVLGGAPPAVGAREDVTELRVVEDVLPEPGLGLGLGLGVGVGVGVGIGRCLRWTKAAWGATARGTYRTPAAGTRAQHVQCVGRWGQAALRLTLVQYARGWYARSVHTVGGPGAYV